jgi:hypothetical protein
MIIGNVRAGVRCSRSWGISSERGRIHLSDIRFSVLTTGSAAPDLSGLPPACGIGFARAWSADAVCPAVRVPPRPRGYPPAGRRRALGLRADTGLVTLAAFDQAAAYRGTKTHGRPSAERGSELRRAARHTCVSPWQNTTRRHTRSGTCPFPRSAPCGRPYSPPFRRLVEELATMTMAADTASA